MQHLQQWLVVTPTPLETPGVQHQQGVAVLVALPEVPQDVVQESPVA